MPLSTSLQTEDNDYLLVAEVAKGNSQAFKRIIIKHEKLVMSIVFKMISRNEDREDLCQDIFLKVYDKLSSFRFQSKLSTWIGNIAFNTCLNFLRKHKAILMSDLNYSTAGGDNDARFEREITLPDAGKIPDELFIDKERKILLIKCIEKLSLMQKMTVELFHYNELSLQEIADVTSMPVTTVKSHLFRARKNLKDELIKSYTNYYGKE